MNEYDLFVNVGGKFYRIHFEFVFLELHNEFLFRLGLLNDVLLDGDFF